MSVYITDNDALQKMGEVEGEYFARQQGDYLGRGLREYTFVGALVSFARSMSEAAHTQDAEEAEFIMDSCGFGTIYGDGGVNRYYVRREGRLAFSRFHSSEEAQDRARKAGFDVE